jgi:TRAP-type C4-dicarboxylate transport system permease large subunit
MRSFVQAATRSGLVLFIVAAAQSLAFVLTLQQVPHALAEHCCWRCRTQRHRLFLLLSIGILIVMGSVLEGAAALIIFGPLLVPVAAQLGIAPLHYGVVLVIAMGIGLFAPPLGLGLYGACLIGNVPIEVTVKPMLALSRPAAALPAGDRDRAGDHAVAAGPSGIRVTPRREPAPSKSRL